MPVSLIVIIGKIILQLSRQLGKGGGAALPGLVAERLDAGIGAKLAARLPHGAIIVTGTNGKTTTTKMLTQVLQDSGERLVVNRAGSNLSRGIVSALIEHADRRGRFIQTMGLFEVDEAAMPAVAAMLKPRSIVVLNLFRDQLDRYGELDTTAALVGKGIKAAGEAQLFLNADDPLVASLATYAHNPKEVRYFGVNEAPLAKLDHDVTADSDNCPVCGRVLVYTKNFYGHIGHYRCPQRHFDRPQPELVGDKIKLEPQRATVSVKLPGSSQRSSLRINLPGIYNIYNALAATLVATGLGIDGHTATASLERVEAAYGRVERIKLPDNKEVYLLLVKNPTGFNQIIQTFLLDKKQQPVLLAINDNFADGRDVSWLWDVAFEELKSGDHVLCATGLRASDMRLRLKYADMETINVDSNIAKSLNQFIDQIPPGRVGYIIPTYTAMLEIRQLLARKTRLAGVWE